MQKRHVLTTALTIMTVLSLQAAFGYAEEVSSPAPQPRTTTRVYTDAQHTFSMAFPEGFTVTTSTKDFVPGGYFPLLPKDMALGGYASKSDSEKTNFSNACIVVSLEKWDSAEKNCAVVNDATFCDAKDGVKDTVIDGTPFKYVDVSDAAVGHRLEIRKYWTQHAKARLEIQISMSYTDIGLYTPGTILEFNKAHCWKKLVNSVNTFTFLDGNRS